MALNSVVLMGRITKDIELKHTATDTEVCNFTIAVDNGKDHEAAFIDCVAWKGTAKFISSFFGKGNLIAVTGNLQSRKWTDKDGNNRTSIEVVVREASFTGEKKDAIASSTVSTASNDSSMTALDVDIEEEELPF